MSAAKHRSDIHTVEKYINKKTIIVGEVNTGKTVYLGKILKMFVDEGEKDLTVIDMAPESTRGIGGKMNMEEVPSIRYYTAKIAAPRLTGKTVDEVQMLAEHNAKRLEAVFLEYVKNPSKILFVNDISIYLQAGDLNKLLLWLNQTPTVVMNGYYGSALGGGKLGERERKNMETLQEQCDRVIRM
jgi:hypothetical protein